MNIEIKDVLTLDDNKDYIVISKINYLDKSYFLLTDNTLGDDRGIKIYYQRSADELVEVEDQDLNQTLFPLFIEEAKNHCTSEELERVNEIAKAVVEAITDI